MSRQITQPVNQVRLTNVAVVRLSRHGNRFEVACYRNKIVNYRQGTETDLSEVLQTTTVFTNVSKGQFAKSSLLKECFGTTDEEEVCRFILDKGEVQISDQERAVQLESMLREVASMVSEKCINPANRRQYTMAQIRDAMKSAGFMVHPTRNVKQQFLDCVRLLQEKKVINIERAKMLLVIVLVSLGGDDDFAERRDATVDLLTDVGIENEHIKPAVEENDPRVIFKSDPSLYRKLEAIAKNPVIKGRLEIIQQCVTDEYDVTLGSDLVQTREQNPPVDTGKKPIEYISDDIDTSLSEKLKSNLDVVDKSSSPIQPQSTQVNSRKAQKAAQKKSKKAKRREKEEQAEREERINAEKERQRARADRLGLTENENNKNGTDASVSGQGSDTKPCNTCGGSFTPGEYRAHFRSDWHRFNVKLKMKSMPPVSEKEFLLCDADEFF